MLLGPSDIQMGITLISFGVQGSNLSPLFMDFPRDAPRAIGALDSKLAPWAKHRGARGRPGILAEAP